MPKDTPEDQETLAWTDPQTGEKFFVDPRTGNSYPANVNRVEDDDICGVDSDPRKGRRTLATRPSMGTLQPLREDEEGEVPAWLQEALAVSETLTLMH